MWHDLAAHAGLVAFRLGEERCLDLRHDGVIALLLVDLGIEGIDRGKRATQIIAVIALAVAEIILGLLPWPEDRVELGAEQALGGRS